MPTLNGQRKLTDKQAQSDKFKQAARDLECDPDEAKWEDKLRKVVKPKPMPENAK
jgi:hypothetical protein